jgi:hypothetical protein
MPGQPGPAFGRPGCKLVPGIHVFLQEAQLSKAWMATEVGLARLPHYFYPTSRVDPTCGDKPGHDEKCPYRK